MRINFDSIKDLLYRNGALLGLLSAVGGFVADVLQPIAPFAEYVLYAAAAIGSVALLIGLLSMQLRTVALSVAMFSVLAVGVSGGLLLLQHQLSAKQQGLLASNVPTISGWQEDMGWLRQDLVAIQQDAKVAAANTTELLQHQQQQKIDAAQRSVEIAEQLADQTKAIEDTGEAMQASIGDVAATLAAQVDVATNDNGIIRQPQTAEDYYHNARLHELGGDYGNARRAYLQYFQLDNPAAQKGEDATGVFTPLDPHLRFQRFLKIQDGVVGAREIYQGLFANSADPVDQYALLLLASPSQKRQKLLAFEQQNPDFAPVYFELAKEHSDLRLDDPTLGEQRLEKDYYTRFLAAAEAGKLTRHFVDNEWLDEWLQSAKLRLQQLAKIRGVAGKSGIEIQVYRREIGWRFELEMAEPATEIWYQMQGNAAFVSTGPTGETNSRTGQPEPRMIIDFPENLPRQEFYLKYQDRKGVVQGPYEFTFDPDEQSIAAQINVLHSYPEEWLDFATFDGYEIYYDFLDQYRCGVKTAWIGYGSREPTEKFELVACDPERYFESSSEDFLIVTVSDPIKVVSMRLEFIDGSKTDTIIFTTDFTEEDAEYFD